MKHLIKLLTLSSSLITGSAYAALINLPNTPLFMGNTVDPNVFFELDDSGSMDWSVLSKPYWHFCAYDAHANGSFSSSECGWLVVNGLIRSHGNSSYRYFTYLWENDGNVYSDGCSSGDRNAVSSCSSAGDKEWRFFNSDVNLIYYNPTLNYIPWQGQCASGTDCANANFSSARANPRNGEWGYSDTRNLTGSVYNVWIDDKGYDTNDGRPQRGSNNNSTNTPNNEVDLWDTHYEIKLNSGNAEIRAVTYNPTTGGINESVNLVATLTNTSACYNILGSKSLVSSIHAGTLGITSTSAPGCRSVTEAKQNFANWYQYNRKRSYVAKSAISSVMNQYPNFRYGLSVINDHSSLFKEVPASSVTDYTAHNQDLLTDLYQYNWSSYGTPLRQGLERVGEYFDNDLSGKSDPIISSCQQNFAILFTDGFWNGSSPSSAIGDADGDGHSRTVADVARYYYNKDLSPLANEVVPNAFDPATYQHMVTYTVAFGVAGNLVDTDDDGWPNPSLTESGNWGNPFNSDPEKVDDLWHAAYNARGTFVAAQSPEAVASELGNALSNIASRVSSAATVAQNSSILNVNSQVYQARFDSSSWKGELLAFDISLQGVLATTPSWNANCLLTGGTCSFPPMTAAQNPGKNPSSRVIITRSWDDANSGTAFDFPSNYNSLSLTTRIQNYMQHSPYSLGTSASSERTANQNHVNRLTDYIRGVRTQEEQFGGSESFRNRQGLLGDIIHGNPIYVGPPSRFYKDSLEASPYSTFKNTYQNRIGVVYSGSNDGMLHGFRADTGEEIIAYIPGDRNIYKNLSDYAQSNYSHAFSVDGSPQEADVFINGTWRSILASGLRSGGQTVFALDVTDPSTFSEANANNTYLWEFSDVDDNDLGYVFGQVKVAKVRFNSTESKWAVIFGNGYNNSASDGHASNNGEAALFILFIERGMDGTWTADTDYIKITAGTAGTTSTPNGLAEPYLVDVDADFIVDYIYAGDLKGNLWKFDLTSTTPTNWKSSASVLFQAQQNATGDQPITAPPVVTQHPWGLNYGVMVYFGTGKYLENNDNSGNGQVTQTFYGIWDKLDGSTVNKTKLLGQTINSEISQNFDTNGDGVDDTTIPLRYISDNPIEWASGSNQHLGWYINLIVQGAGSNNGERQITRPLIRNGNVVFTTLIPSQSPCEFGGSSWLMELDKENGGSPNQAPFDLNNDGVFDKADYIDVGDIDGDGVNDKVPPGGKKSDVGITPTPAVFVAEDKSKETKVMSGSNGLTTIDENVKGGALGRQNWKQISQ